MAVGTRSLLSSNPASGTFAYSAPNGDVAASHVLADARTLTEKSFRTEELIHVAHFGEWVFVARKDDPDQRVLLKRAGVSEFSKTSQVVNKNKETFVREAEVAVGRTFAGQMEQIVELRDALDKEKGGHAQSRSLLNSMTDQLILRTSELNEARVALAALRRHAHDDGGVQSATHRTAVSVMPIIQTIVRESDAANDGPRIAVSHDGTQTDGMPVRPLGVYGDLVRVYGQDVIASCRAKGELLDLVQFEDGVSDWGGEAAPQGFGNASAQLDKYLSMRNDSEQTLVLVQGGASYTGSSAENFELSERRAEWVKAALLRKLLDVTKGEAADLDRAAQVLKQVNLVAFGLGERVGIGDDGGRSVEIRICKPEKPEEPEASEQLAGSDPQTEQLKPVSADN